MRTILVTGGAGFIGSNFIHYLLKEYPDYQVVNLDKLTYAGNPANLKQVENWNHYHFIQGDICRRELAEDIFKQFPIDCLVNFAAETHVDRSIITPEIFVQTNVLGTVNLLNTAKRQWEKTPESISNKRFIQISTDEVYGSLGKEGYFTETTPLDPHSPYAASKASADLLVKSYFDTYGLPINITRSSNNYGPYQFLEKLIPLVITNALHKKDIPVYGDGLNVRDWLYVEDHCAALALVMQKGKAGEIYNIGGHQERPNLQLIKMILTYLHNNVDSSITENLIKYVEDRKGHDRRYGIDPTKIRTELGWSAKTPLDTGIKKTIRWYLDHEEWTRDLIVQGSPQLAKKESHASGDSL